MIVVAHSTALGKSEEQCCASAARIQGHAKEDTLALPMAAGTPAQPGNARAYGERRPRLGIGMNRNRTCRAWTRTGTRKMIRNRVTKTHLSVLRCSNGGLGCKLAVGGVSSMLWWYWCAMLLAVHLLFS